MHQKHYALWKEPIDFYLIENNTCFYQRVLKFIKSD